MAKDQRNSVAILCGTLALLAMMATGISHAAAGRTQGSFNVSPTGAASYTIPIFTPPGPNGVQPSVALAYNSNGGFGYAGKGWSLAGSFSSITRCGRTLPQDGWARPVSMDAGDRLCLDGNRLRLQTSSASYGHGGSDIVYATEIADFSRITSSGLVCTGTYATYCGPQYWTVERKDGLIYTYGGTPNSRVVPVPAENSVSQWLLSEIQDRNGNKVKFTWKTPDENTVNMSHPVQIEWTQTSEGSGTYVYSMDFTYDEDGNVPESMYSAYEAGELKQEAALLTDISISVSEALVRKYVLDYDESSSTEGMILTSIEECAYDEYENADCLPPTEIQYADPTPGFSTSGTTYNLGGSIFDVRVKFDVNGDGIKDLFYWDGSTNKVRLGSKTSGYASAISTGANGYEGKFLGNAADQFLWVNGSTWHIYYWNGSGFSSLDTGIAATALPYNLIITDINADGLDDLVYISETGTVLNEWLREVDPVF